MHFCSGNLQWPLSSECRASSSVFIYRRSRPVVHSTKVFEMVFYLSSSLTYNSLVIFLLCLPQKERLTSLFFCTTRTRGLYRPLIGYSSSTERQMTVAGAQVHEFMENGTLSTIQSSLDISGPLFIFHSLCRKTIFPRSHFLATSRPELLWPEALE